MEKQNKNTGYNNPKNNHCCPIKDIRPLTETSSAQVAVRIKNKPAYLAVTAGRDLIVTN